MKRINNSKIFCLCLWCHLDDRYSCNNNETQRLWSDKSEARQSLRKVHEIWAVLSSALDESLTHSPPVPTSRCMWSRCMSLYWHVPPLSTSRRWIIDAQTCGVHAQVGWFYKGSQEYFAERSFVEYDPFGVRPYMDKLLWKSWPQFWTLEAVGNSTTIKWDKRGIGK